MFVLPENGEEGSGEEVGKRSKWVKTGIEYYNGQVLVSTVVRDRWADWSLYPAGIREVEGKKGVELLIERCEFDFLLCFYVLFLFWLVGLC